VTPWTPDGKFVISLDSPSSETPELGGIILWDVASGNSRKFHGRVRPEAVALNPKGNIVAISGRRVGSPRLYGTVTIFESTGSCLIDFIELATGKILCEIDTGKVRGGYSMAWSDDGEMVALDVLYSTVSDPASVRVWNVSNQQLVYEEHENETAGGLAQLIWVDNLLAWRLGNIVRFRKPPSTVPAMPDIEMNFITEPLVWNKVTNLMAFITATGLTIYDPVAHETKAHFLTNASPAYSGHGLGSVAWSGDGLYLAASNHPSRGVASDSNRIFIFDSSGRLLRAITIPQAVSLSVISFSPNGSWILVRFHGGSSHPELSLVNFHTGEVTMLKR